jgi:cell division protein FtsZ
MSDENIMPFDFPQQSNIIKVIGVGGGGGNAVNHMFREGIHDVTFVVCNTDHQALQESPVPVKIQLGSEGLGAGNRPERAREAAQESLEEIKNMLSDGCKMAFITAGMGGGTGTGAAPIIAQTAKAMGILTVGIVTIPFLFEGNKKIDQALDGVEQMSQHVDALLVINDERLRDVYSDLSVMNAFGRADDTLSIAAKSIAEIITIRGKINLDFRDVETVVKDGGVAIMSTGYGTGENRLSKAINDALHSPLLNNNDVFNSKKILFNITYSTKNELMMEEMNELHDFMSKFSNEVETKWGLYEDDALDDKVKFTVLATGFGIENVPGMEKVLGRHTIEEQKRLEELEEKAMQDEERRAKYYGSDRTSKVGRKKRHNIYLFNLEDLDNDDVISVIDTTPTFSRAKTVVEGLQATQDVKEEAAAQDAISPSADNAGEGSNAIMF